MCEYAYFIDVGEKKLRKLEIVPLEKAQEKKLSSYTNTTHTMCRAIRVCYNKY